MLMMATMILHFKIRTTWPLPTIIQLRSLNIHRFWSQTCIWSLSSSVSWTPPSPAATALCSSRNVVPSSSPPSYSPSSPVLASSRRSASWYSALLGSCCARWRIRLPRCANCLWQCVHWWFCIHTHRIPPLLTQHCTIKHYITDVPDVKFYYQAGTR